MAKKLSKSKMLELIRSIKESEAKKKSLEDAVTEAKDQLKAHMELVGAEELQVDVFTLRYKEVVSNRFDSAAFKQINPGVYEKYLTASISKKFTIS